MKNWLTIMKGIVPIVVATTVPGAGPLLAGLIVHGIEVAENAKQPGSKKLEIAKEEIRTAAAGINAVKPNTVDVGQLSGVMDQVINAAVDSANLIKNVPVKNVQVD